VTISHVTGDLFASGEKHIAHGCNTDGVMGAGVAGVIAARWPEVERVYSAYCRTKRFAAGTCLPVPIDEEFVIYNLGTQRRPGNQSHLGKAAYWPILLAFGNLFEYCVDNGIERVAIPRIGCGIAGLDWATVEGVINGIYEYIPDGPEIVVYTHTSEADKKW
jgi:O-acetyl-ADP-ribose deacetylase (regulator of RNase III)